jgi:hypothetical protein
MSAMQARANMLRSAGFHIVYAQRPDESSGSVPWSGHYTSALDGMELYADLSRVGSGEDAYGQVDTVARSNFRSLIRDYPDVFTVTSYSNVDALGAFVADLTDDLAEVLVKLTAEYAVYDEPDLSELESDEITESWSWFVSSDIRDHIADLDSWDVLSSDAQREMFWDACSVLDIYPEHNGREVVWREDHYHSAGAEIDKRLAGRG